MNKELYLNDINTILIKCEADHSYVEKKKNTLNNDKIPFTMRKFKNMYAKYLYKKNINKK